MNGCLALARVESARLLRSPVVLASVALSAPLLALGPGTDDAFVRYKLLAGAGCLVVAVGVGVAATLAAARTRRSGADELFASLPGGASDVTPAQLLSVGASLLPAFIVLAVVAARLHVWDGFPVPQPPGWAGAADPIRLTPSLAALLQGPAVVILAGVTGVALGVWVRSAMAASMLLLGAGYVLPLPMLWWAWDWRQWLLPLAHGLDTGPALAGPDGPLLVVEGAETAAMGWHVLYLLALIAVVAAGALVRSRPSWARYLAVGGLAVGAGAGTLQVVTAH